MQNKNVEKILSLTTKFRFFLMLGAFAMGIFAGILIQKNEAPAPSSEVAHRSLQGVTLPGGLQGNYKFINPLLLVETPDASTLPAIAPLHDEIQKFIDQETENKNADNVSVYFRDSNTGWWFGVNDETTYAPASLVKVPLMIAVFKLAESDPSLLKRQLMYDGSFDENKVENFSPVQSIVAGKAYSVEELLHFMITYSDNNAYRLLVNNMDPRTIEDVYGDLGISVPMSLNVTDFITVKSYSYFFRILYNSTYLTETYSEKALELLAEVDFPQGIVSSVPSSVPVANKFGERVFFDVVKGENTHELHDCGYVYYPNQKPYLICIMTRGKNFDLLIPIIQNISRMSYEWFQQKYH